jgi:hypothetical protein
MTRDSEKQLELDFDGEIESSERTFHTPSARVPSSVVCFSAHLQLRRAYEEKAKEAKMLERITSRVRNFR